MDKGENIIINPGNSEEAKHLQEKIHALYDVSIKTISNEENWTKRGIKEAVQIRKRKPSLNADLGRYNLSEIWTRLIQKEEVDAASAGHVPEKANDTRS